MNIARSTAELRQASIRVQNKKRGSEVMFGQAVGTWKLSSASAGTPRVPSSSLTRGSFLSYIACATTRVATPRRRAASAGSRTSVSVTGRRLHQNPTYRGEPESRWPTVLKSRCNATLAQRETGVLPRLQYAEGLVEVEHDGARYRVVGRFVSTHQASLHEGCNTTEEEGLMPARCSPHKHEPEQRTTHEIGRYGANLTGTAQLSHSVQLLGANHPSMELDQMSLVRVDRALDGTFAYSERWRILTTTRMTMLAGIIHRM